MVFLGTITDALATRDGRVVRARMRVDRDYKGTSEGTLVVFDDGPCDGPELEVGQHYLMYTHRLGDGDVPSRGCTRSRNVKYAAEDLQYLDALDKAAPRVQSSVKLRPGRKAAAAIHRYRVRP